MTPTKVLQVFSPQNSSWQFNLSSPSEAPFAFPSTWYLDPQVLTSQPWGASHGEVWAGGRPPLPGQGSSQPTPGDTTRTCPLGLLLPRASRHMSSCQPFSGRLLSAEKQDLRMPLAAGPWQTHLRSLPSNSTREGEAEALVSPLPMVPTENVTST